MKDGVYEVAQTKHRYNFKHGHLRSIGFVPTVAMPFSSKSNALQTYMSMTAIASQFALHYVFYQLSQDNQFISGMHRIEGVTMANLQGPRSTVKMTMMYFEALGVGYNANVQLTPKERKQSRKIRNELIKAGVLMQDEQGLLFNMDLENNLQNMYAMREQPSTGLAKGFVSKIIAAASA